MTDRLSIIRYDEDSNTRHGHLLSLMMFTGAPGPADPDEKRDINPVFLEFTLAAYLGWKDFNERRSGILPHLPELLEGCDFYMSYEARDSAFSARHSVNEVLAASSGMWETTGARRKRQRQRGLKHVFRGIDITTERANEDNNDRDENDVVNVNDNLNQQKGPQQWQWQQEQMQQPESSTKDARAVMAYYHRQGASKVAVVFANDPYGIQYTQTLEMEAHRLGIQMVSFPIENKPLNKIMKDLKECGAKDVFALLREEEYQTVVEAAVENGVFGNADYSWLAPKELIPEHTITSALQQQRELQDEAVETDNQDTSKGTQLVIIDILPYEEEEDENDEINSQQEQQQPQQAPFAIAGNLFSSITTQVSTLSSGLEIPQISGTATSMDLEGRELFARTISTNAQDAQAVMAYYNSLGVSRLASVFINEPYGIQYNKALKIEAGKLGITLVSFPMQKTSLDPSMEDLKESQARYVFAMILEEDYEPVMKAAYRNGVMGTPEYAWMIPELSYLSAPAYALDRATQSDLAHAMHGLGIINLQMESPHQHLFDEAIQELVVNETQFQEFVALTATTNPDPLFYNYTRPSETFPFLYHHLIYDGVIAMGLAACNTPGLFTGREVFETLLETRFEGVSGTVRFDPNTHTRDAKAVEYRLDNLLLSDARSTATEFKFETAESVIVRGNETYEKWPFTYASNTTIPPPDLPPLDGYDHNLIPQPLLVLGYCMGGAILLSSLVSLCWTIDQWKSFVVSAAQPWFLLQLCLGTIIMGLAIFPLGMQGEEPAKELDQACMAIPWLLFLGFVISLAALMSKTWRVSKIMGGTNRGKKTLAVSPKDVLAPLFILLPFNVAMLAAWTVVSPYQYVRIDIENYDEFGRSVESIGTCQCPNNWVWLFASLMCAANFSGVLFVAIQCYQTRHVSLYFSETHYLALSLASLTETALLGGPLIFLVKDRPTAFFMTCTALICIVCLCFLIPIFGFKFQNADATYEDAKRDIEELERHESVANRRQPSQAGHSLMHQDSSGLPRNSSSAPRLSNLSSAEFTGSINNQDLPAGFMALHRRGQPDDDDSIGGASHMSGRTHKSHKSTKSNKSTSTKHSLLSEASSRLSMALKRTSSRALSRAGSRAGSFHGHGRRGSLDDSTRSAPAFASSRATGLLDPVKESTTSQYASSNLHTSRPLSQSLTRVPSTSKQFSETSRRRSTKSKKTLPSSVSFSSLNLGESEVSEAFTDDGSRGDEDPTRRKSISFAALARLSMLPTSAPDAPPTSVSFTNLNLVSEVSEAFTDDGTDDDGDDRNTRWSMLSDRDNPMRPSMVLQSLAELDEEFTESEDESGAVGPKEDSDPGLSFEGYNDEEEPQGQQLDPPTSNTGIEQTEKNEEEKTR